MFNEDFDAHDALEDAIALRKILFGSEMAIDVNTIVDSCQMSSVTDVAADLKFIDNRYDRYQTFSGNLYSSTEDQSPITHGMALKIAESGLSYSDLLAKPDLLEYYPCRHMKRMIVRPVELRRKVVQESRKTSGFFQILSNTFNQILFQVYQTVARKNFKVPVTF